MQAPRWLGECGNYLGRAQAGSGLLTREDLARMGITLSGDRPTEPTPISVPVPVPDPRTFLPPTTTTPVAQPPAPMEEAIPVDITYTRYEPPPVTEPIAVPEVTPDGQVVQVPMVQRVATGSGATRTVVKEKTELPKWVVPALIAAATMLLGGGGS